LQPTPGFEFRQDWVLSVSTNDKGQFPGSGGMSPEERAAFEKRAANIGDKLNVAKGRHPAQPQAGSGAGSDKAAATSRALRVSTELIGGIVVGGAIGYGLDRWLGNEKPWFFILFFMLGTAAGILNVVRTAAKEKTPPAPPVPDEDEDK
jgi:ATP synthase protein I